MKKTTENANNFCLKMGEFQKMGDAGSIFQALLVGVEYPVKTRDELLKKVGGEDRILKLRDASGLMRSLYCVKDIFEAIPKFDKFFPIKSEKELINSILESDKKYTGSSNIPKIHGRIQNKYLDAAQKKKKYIAKNKMPEYEQYPVNFCCDIPNWMLCIDTEWEPELRPPNVCAYRDAIALSGDYRNEAHTQLDQIITENRNIDNLISEYKSNRVLFCNPPR